MYYNIYTSNLINTIVEKFDSNKKFELVKKYLSKNENEKQEAYKEIDKSIVDNLMGTINNLSLKELKNLDNFYQNDQLLNIDTSERVIKGNEIFYFRNLVDRRLANFFNNYVKYKERKEAEKLGNDKTLLRKFEKENRILDKILKISEKNPEKAKILWEKFIKIYKSEKSNQERNM